MDVDVEADLLYNIIDGLSKSAQVLTDATNDMSSYTNAASATLSGNQYSMPVDETDHVCKSIEEAVDNMGSLSKYVSNLAQHLEEYFKCKYNEG